MTSMIWRDTHHFNENLSNKHGGIIWMYWDLGVSSTNHLDTTEMMLRILGNFPNMAEVFRWSGLFIIIWIIWIYPESWVSRCFNYPRQAHGRNFWGFRQEKPEEKKAETEEEKKLNFAKPGDKSWQVMFIQEYPGSTNPFPQFMLNTPRNHGGCRGFAHFFDHLRIQGVAKCTHGGWNLE